MSPARASYRHRQSRAAAVLVLLLALPAPAAAAPAWTHPLRAMRRWLEPHRQPGSTQPPAGSIADKHVGPWAAGASSLYATDFTSTVVSPAALKSLPRMMRRLARPAGKLLCVTGPVGGVALLARSAACWPSARGNDKLDLSGDVAWGVQGCLYATKATTGLLPMLGRGLGVVGAGCQVVAGCRRVREGRAKHDRGLVCLGALDIGAGLLGIGLDLFALYTPAYFGAYLAVATSRELYAYRQPLGAWLRRHTPGRRTRGAAADAAAHAAPLEGTPVAPLH